MHSSDWQIGKVFRFVDNATMGLLQEARLRAINRLGEFAGEHGVRHILVAGDVYEMEAISPRSLNQPLERMRTFGAVQWHLLPGNHDPHRPNGLWGSWSPSQIGLRMTARECVTKASVDKGKHGSFPSKPTHGGRSITVSATYRHPQGFLFVLLLLSSENSVRLRALTPHRARALG